jgi:hypothetical protein
MAGNPREGTTPAAEGMAADRTLTRDIPVEPAGDPGEGSRPAEAGAADDRTLTRALTSRPYGAGSSSPPDLAASRAALPGSDLTLDASTGREPVDTRTPAPQFAGDHTLLRQIGVGGMGAVFEARTPDGTVVALKFIGDTSPERLYRFKREFRTLSAIVHPNLVELYELRQVGPDEAPSVFFTMERLHGEHFVAAVRRGHEPGAALDADGLRRLQHALVGLACGLACIHRNGLVHRDVKPSNVMITGAGRVVVLDLGLVREVRTASLDSAAIVGTPLYMAPEQVVDVDSVGPPADWYAVGEILWEALTGAQRLDGSVHAILERKLNAAALPPSSAGVAAPAELERLCHELERLCLDLLARDPAARPGAAEVLTRLGRADLVANEVVSDGLVGRAAETQALREVIGLARPGRPSVAALAGRSGFGKSTLMAHVVAQARRELGVVAFMGNCSERETIPFKALDTALDELAVHLCSHGVTMVGAVAVAALARLFPVLRSVPQIRAVDEALLAGIDPVEVRRHAADALADLLTEAAGERALVLVLDNLQWADLDSVQLLAAVLQRPTAPPLALLCAFHEGADATRPPLMQLLARLRAMAHVQLQALTIGPFSEAQGSALAAHHLGLGSADPLSRRIARESEGSPFFIGELARFARSHGGLTESVANLSLDEVIRLRLRGLPAAARRLVEVLALAGGRLRRDVAVKVVEASAGAIDRGALARLRAEHLIRADGADDDVLETFHDRIRATAAAEAHSNDPAGLQATHGSIAAALLAAGGADHATLAHHFKLAGDRVGAGRHMLLAAREAAAQLAFERAAELLAARLELGELARGEATRLRAELAAALANSGQLYASAQAYRAAAGAGDDGATEAERTEWLRLAAMQLLQTGQHDEGKATLAQLLPRVGLAMSHGVGWTIARLLVQRARLAFRRLELPRAGSRALAEADAQRLDVCWTATRGLQYVDGLSAALFHARHLDLALASGDAVRAARAIGFEVYLRVAMQGTAASAATQAGLAALAAAPAVQASPYARGMILQFMGSSHQLVGRYPETIAALDEAIEILRGQCVGELQEVAQMQAHKAMALMFLGRYAEMRALAEGLVRECASRPNLYVEGFARGTLITAGFAADAVAEAAEQLGAYERDGPMQFEGHYHNWSCQRAELERYRGDGERAWAVHVEDCPTIERLGAFRSPCLKQEYLRQRACNALALAVRRRDPRELLAIARAAADRCLRERTATAAAYGHVALAGVAAVERRTDVAVRELRVGIAEYERLSMAAYLAACRRTLAGLVGGDEGRALRGLADEWFAAEQVRRPDRLTDMIVPGFQPQD